MNFPIYCGMTKDEWNMMVNKSNNKDEHGFYANGSNNYISASEVPWPEETKKLAWKLKTDIYNKYKRSLIIHEADDDYKIGSVHDEFALTCIRAVLGHFMPTTYEEWIKDKIEFSDGDSCPEYCGMNRIKGYYKNVREFALKFNPDALNIIARHEQYKAAQVEGW